MSMADYSYGHFEIRAWDEFMYDAIKIEIRVKPYNVLKPKKGYTIDSNWLENKTKEPIGFEYEEVPGGGFVVAVPKEVFYYGSMAKIVDACMPPEFMEWGKQFDGLLVTYRNWVIKEIQKNTSLAPLAVSPKYAKGGWVDAGYLDIENPYSPYSKGYTGIKPPSDPERLSQRLPGVNEVGTNPVTGKKGVLWNVIQHLNDRDKWTREQIADWVETLDIDIRFKTDETTD